jgi:hypothetical protein
VLFQVIVSKRQCLAGGEMKGIEVLSLRFEVRSYGDRVQGVGDLRNGF